MTMNILLGTTGSVAALLTDKLAAALADAAITNRVAVVPTEKAHFFIDRSRDPLEAPDIPLRTDVFYYNERWEWPVSWKKDDDVMHINLRRWADVLVIAPITANTLTKCAVGICDNLLTSVVYCWDASNPVIVAPAMNTLMWENPLTGQNIKVLEERGWQVVPPVSKKLACGDEGVGAMAQIDDIVAAVMKGH